MIRNITFRRGIIALTLFVGLFTQFQMVFACELMDGDFHLVCCCDKSGHMPTSCAMDRDCQNQDTLGSSDTVCCKVSYQQVPSTIAAAPASHVQQVLLLDVSQPPPPPLSSQVNPARNRDVGFNNFSTSQIDSTKTYLLTHRLRI